MSATNSNSKAEKLHQLKLISTKNPEDQLLDVCCDVNSKQCMYRECQFCVNKDVLFASGVPDNSGVSRTGDLDHDRKAQNCPSVCLSVVP